MKKRYLLPLIALIILGLFGACKEEEKNPKYLFLFIGDGMGLGQEQLAESFLGAYDQAYPTPQLHMTRMPQKGIVTTYSKSHKITDSAAAGTAFSSGEKTTNGMVMMNPDTTQTYTSVATYAKKKGMKIGIISTVSLDHATPAVFYAHAPSRNNYYEIGMQLPESGFDYFAGGGFRDPKGLKSNTKYSENYTNQKTANNNTGEGKKDLLTYAKEKGYTLINSKQDFKALPADAEKIIAINPELQGGAAMPYTIDRTEGSLALSDYVSKGIEILDNDKGFFMMVEGGKIDWACHANDAIAAIHEMVDFDKAIGEALKFYEQHPEETLIVITGDHETGGLSMGNTLSGKKTDYQLLKNQTASLEVIEKEMRALVSPSFDQVMEVVKSYFGLGDKIALTPYDEKRLQKAYRYAFVAKDKVSPREANRLYGYYEPVCITAAAILAEKAGIAWTTFSHTSMPLPVHSIGAGSDQFGGFYDNTDIPKRFMALIDKQ
ncbi:MAG: alkaline phosphatase [Bacteroidetes bacterium]|nr:MAG: alkaline phosphatase [Bacteroidota bacterium]